MESALIFLATGVIAGLLAGLFGIGGGVIIVPALAFVLPLQHVPDQIYMHVAIGTSLAVISATAVASTRAHHRRGGVDTTILLRFAPGLVLGALAGAALADALSGPTLKRIVGIGACLMAAQMTLRGARAADHADGLRAGGLELFGAGGVVGCLSSLVGVGGGTLTVPYLSARGLPLHRAVGTSAASGVPIAWAGTVGFIVNGWGVAGVPAPHLGYVSLSAFAAMVVTSVICAPLGATLAHRLPPHWLRRGFALLLVLVGGRMLLT